MKKFYIPIFAVVFLLTSLLSHAQTTYISISSNPSGFTLDDGNFWVGGIAPPNPCNDCIIKIYADVSMVQNGFSSVPAYNCGGCTFLNDVALNNSSVNVYGNTALSINTYLQLFNSTIVIGNDPVSIETIFVNDQVDLDPTSTIQLANSLTVVNTNNDAGNTVIGPHKYFVGNSHIAGIYSIRAVPLNAVDFTLNNLLNANYNLTATVTPFYTLNCDPATTCAAGLVFGPAVTQFDNSVPNGFNIFAQSTTLPVQLAQFLALKNGDGSVKLIWATSQEVNAGYFDIERSGDQSAWTKIGSVKAVGNSSTTSNYSYIDRLPVDGTGYYKLKMVDLDGKFKYSKTVAVTIENDSRPLVVYSNPFSDMIRLKVNVSRGQNLTMTVSDMLGKTYINQNYHAQSGDNLVNLPSSISSHGVYILRIYGESYDQTVKLQKQ
jgi:hypothetical protein